MKKLLTIFTPTYNRAYCLPALYDSLCRQTSRNFVWLVVDDGSMDNTSDLIKQWIDESKISIEYYYQRNQGKSMAHNEGVRKCSTELFTCLDSDDTLTANAVELITREWKKMFFNNTGLLLRKFNNINNLPVTQIPEGLKESTLYDAYNRHGLKGDTMLVFRTSVINQFEFPQFDGEKFVPESYLYDLIDTKGTLRMVNEAVYRCEYLADGYTSNMARLLKNNPNGYIAYINQRLQLLDKSPKWKFLNSARYVSMMLTFDRKHVFSKAVYPFYTLLAYPLGYLVYCRKFRHINR